MQPPDPVQLTIDLMKVDSTSGQEGEVIDLAEALLVSRGWSITRIPVTSGRDNLLAEWGESPLVTFSTHLDTVPPFIPPTLEADRILGRGACDAKGIAAAMICAAEGLREEGIAVALLLVVGEEVSHDGANAANLHPNSSRVLINGEPTEGQLAVGTKGAVRFILRTEGVPAHSAYPELGESATLALARLLVELQSVELPVDRVLGATTINIGVIAGGVADNVVAPWAEARLMARTVGPVEELTELLRGWLAGRASIEATISVPPVQLNTLGGFPTSVVAFATDIPALTGWGKPYLFGPGSIHVAHRDDEFILTEELHHAVEAYKRIAREALAALD